MKAVLPYEITKLFEIDKETGLIDTTRNYAHAIDENFKIIIKYLNDLITGINIINGSIDTSELADSSVTSDKIDSLAVLTEKINNLAVNASKIDVNAVTTTKIQDLAVTNAKIGELAVTEAKIANLGVTSGKIANLAVGEAKISNSAITSAKIGNLAVETAKIKDLNVTNAKINTVNAVKITPAWDGGWRASGASGGYITRTHSLGYFPSSMQLFGGNANPPTLIYDESYYANMDIHWCSKTQVKLFFLDGGGHGLQPRYRIFLFK